LRRDGKAPGLSQVAAATLAQVEERKMASNRDRQRSRQQGIKVLERGDIYFIYRPKIEEASAAGLADVQRLFMILSPHHKKRYRLFVIGRKRLPEVSDSGQRTWGFVEKACRAARALQEELAPATYQTKTRGERTPPAARPAGEGVYAIVRHADHTHLLYALELSDQPGEVQEELHLADEGSYIVSVKNPEQPSPPGVGLGGGRQDSFPKTLQGRFRGRRFMPVDPPNFLDYEGAEVLLIGASEDVSEELDVQLHPQEETAATAEIFKDLHLDRARHPTKPLFEGIWE
jgi:hypothetical protein